MFDSELLRQQLGDVLAALERVPIHTSGIASSEEFASSPEGLKSLDAVCMVLIAVGEAFKKIDRHTAGELLPKYPQVDWSGVKGVRDVIAHGYFDVDAEEVFDICRNDVPPLIETVRKMIADLSQS